MTPGAVFTPAPGPAGATPATLAALSQPILHHQDPALPPQYARTVGARRRTFGASVPPLGEGPLYQRGLSGIPAAKRPGTESGGPPCGGSRMITRKSET